MSNKLLRAFKTTGLLLALGVSMSVLLNLTAHAASFDCAKAGTNVEKLVCADAELSKLDERMAKNYNDALKTYPVPGALKLRQKQWLKRRNACVPVEADPYHEQDVIDKSTTNCLKESYEQRLTEIDSLSKADLPCPELPLIKSESEKAQCLKRWLTKHPLELNREHMPVQDQKFCTDFYQALATASPEVHYIEPVLRTENPLDPGLAKYRQCREFEAVGLGEDYYGLDVEAHGFRLYRVDLDGNPKNGLEEYLYEEESRGSMQDGHSQYVRVEFNPDGCYVKNSPNVSPQEPRRMPSISWGMGLNSLTLFRGRYQIFDLQGTSWLSTIAYDQKKHVFSLNQCNWQIPRQLLNEQSNSKD